MIELHSNSFDILLLRHRRRFPEIASCVRTAGVKEFSSRQTKVKPQVRSRSGHVPNALPTLPIDREWRMMRSVLGI